MFVKPQHTPLHQLVLHKVLICSLRLLRWTCIARLLPAGGGTSGILCSTLASLPVAHVRLTLTSDWHSLTLWDTSAGYGLQSMPQSAVQELALICTTHTHCCIAYNPPCRTPEWCSSHAIQHRSASCAHLAHVAHCIGWSLSISRSASATTVHYAHPLGGRSILADKV